MAPAAAAGTTTTAASSSSSVSPSAPLPSSIELLGYSDSFSFRGAVRDTTSGDDNNSDARSSRRRGAEGGYHHLHADDPDNPNNDGIDQRTNLVPQEQRHRQDRDSLNGDGTAVNNNNDDGDRNPHSGHVITGSGSNSNKLGVRGLAVVVFYSVSGGPFGLEASVRSAGNLCALLGFATFPWIWSVQEALVTAELGSALPSASAGVAWVETAFGHKAGWMCGYLSWISGATDNAIYPVLFLDYLLEGLAGSGYASSGGEGGGLHLATRFLLLSTIAVSLAYINWLGLPLVSNMSSGICLVAMSPFVVLILVGMFQVDPSRWFELPTSPARYHNETISAAVVGSDDNGGDNGGGIIPNVVVFGGIVLRPFLNNLFWNLNSFDSAAAFCEDIQEFPSASAGAASTITAATALPGSNAKNIGRVLSRGLFWAFLMAVLGYFLPLLVALGASDAAQEDWVDGYLAVVASDIAGPWLGAWTVLAAGISNVALFQAELSSDAFQVMGMAERGYLPQIFAHRSRHGTPTYGIVLGTAIIVAMTFADLDQLIEMLNFNYGISLLMEYLAFLKLRVSRPDLDRPFRVPFGTIGCAVLLSPTILFTIIVMGLASFQTYLFSLVVNIVGYGLYVVMQRRQRRRRSEGAEGTIPRDDDENGNRCWDGVFGRCQKRRYNYDRAEMAVVSASHPGEGVAVGEWAPDVVDHSIS